MSEEKFITVEELILRAKEVGVNFGAGEPYNRLRYYTKMNWIPHMSRKGKNVKGHYEEWVIGRLKTIEDLRKRGLNKDEITNELNKIEKRTQLQKVISNTKVKKTLPLIILFLILALLTLNELDLVKIGKNKKDIMPLKEEQTTIFP